MSHENDEPIWRLLGLLFRAHPWHGVPIGPDAPATVNTYIEIVPTDTVKYELEKITGLLRIDRPQLYSNVCPALYGLIPQTFCGERVGAYCAERAGLSGVRGDQDPLDVCVLTEKTISHGDVLLRARPVGGLRMIDNAEADDKVLAVMEGDAVYGRINDVSECPGPLIERLKHYFLTYKLVPGQKSQARITKVYGRDHARKVVRAAIADYDENFGI